jgi:tetratricopeptide (TPR) repeat protein
MSKKKHRQAAGGEMAPAPEAAAPVVGFGTISVPSADMPRLQYWLAILAIWAAGFITYSNGFSIAFQFDDTHTVQSNMYVRSLRYIPLYFVDAKTFSYRPENSGYRPMTTTALALGFQLSHMDTWGYHLIKIIEHCLIATLIFILGLRLLPHAGAAAPYRFLVSLFGGLIFVSHRALTETVDYISAISTLQAGLFYIVAFYIYLRSREPGMSKGARYALRAAAALSFLCSMWSKEEGVTLPAMIVFYEWIYGRRPEEGYLQRLRANWWRWAVLAAPYVATAALFIVLRMTFQPSVADTSRGNVPTFNYFITQFRSWQHYGALFFFPYELNADNLAFDFSPGLEDWRVWVALLLHAAVWWLTLRYGRRRRFVLFAVTWAYITVLPASSIFPLVEAVNEHRFYIPFMFMALLTAWLVVEGCCALSARSSASLKPARNFAALALGIFVLAQGIGAHARNEVWQTDISLWEDVLSKNPQSPRAMNVLGVSLMNRGNFDRSAKLLEECHRIAPAYLPCVVHLSINYAHFKEFDKGLAILRQGNQIDPNYVHVNFHLGFYYKEYFGDFDKARYYLKKVVELTSGRFFQATLKLAEMEMEDGRVDDGMRIASQVLQVDQSNGDAWDVFGKGYVLKGDLNSATHIAMRLYESAPDSVRYILNVANIAERKRDYQIANEFYRKAIQKEPNETQGWAGLRRIAAATGDKASEAEAARKYLEVKSGKDWVYLASMFFPGDKPKQVKPE